MPSLPKFMRRKSDPVRLVLQGYGLETGGTKDECLARLAHHMQRHPDAGLDDTSPELELAAQHLRRWYSKGTGLSINSTWFLGGERLRPWQQGTEIHHQGTMRRSMYRRSQRAPPPLAVQTEEDLTLDDGTLSDDEGDDLPDLADPPRIHQSLRSPHALWRSPRVRTPKTPRTPGGSIVKLLFRDV
eukprot:COSAG02_NODE_1632_length_11568_cov_4.882640_7_plen_186_part_00